MHKFEKEIVLDTKIKMGFRAIVSSFVKRMIIISIFDDILSFVSGVLV